MQTSPRGIALVTGAPRRIGRVISLELAALGYDLALHCRVVDAEARDLVESVRAIGRRAVALPADLADAAATTSLIARAAEALGRVNLLVNNASIFLDDTVSTLQAEAWDRQFAVNLRAPVLLSQAFAANLDHGQKGNVINVLDQRVWRPTPEYFAYAVSKSALWSATRMLAQALAPNIRVNGIGPGPTLKNIHQSDAEFAAQARSTLLGHGTSPQEIAAAIRFLLDAPAVTGQMIAVDGGQHLAWTPIDGGAAPPSR